MRQADIRPFVKGLSRLSVAIFLLLAGCTEQTELVQDLHDYQQRLANLLKSPAPSSITITSLSYPELRELQTALTSTHIKLFELYALSNCAVAVKIAERNTPLGRTQYPSRRYIYEVELIESMQSCLASEQDPLNQQNLENWLRIKTQNLPLVWAGLMQSSEEMRRAFASNQGFIQGNEQDGLRETQAALQYLLELYEHPLAQSHVLEEHLKLLSRYQLPARLWRSELLITAEIAQTTQWLKQQEVLTLCPHGKASQQVEYLNNVFKLFFIEKIQVLSSRIDQYHYQLSPLLERFINKSALNSQFRALISHHQTDTYQQYRLALQEHITLWQALYRNCKLIPGH